ncbi:MAG: D-alanyl-D-alanine endopeptidase [Gammaproteobacteria bacterium]|nr:D-alanyl-D-alanine endopeptidase [Gammaproteobacteria bacterium]MDE2249997.1 D-alanyl-D-alanine endopeptidase [Gammaproteobacteria bacterium]
MQQSSYGLVSSLFLVAVLAFTAAPAAARHARAHAPAATDDPQIRSNAVLVLDEDSSTVLLARQAEVATPIASITKLMTALVVTDARQPLDEVLQITDEDREHGRGAFSRLAVGTRLSRGDLLHLALMSSENRAAHALGRNFPGGLPAFVAAMNAKARALGMHNAHFVDPTGLSGENVASPADLSKLVIAASHEPTIQRYSTDELHAVRVGRRIVEFRNTDLLVRNPAWNIVVQKTGYITEAGKCLVMKALIRGRAIVIVLLDSFGKYTRVADAQRIRRWLEARPADAAVPGTV